MKSFVSGFFINLLLLLITRTAFAQVSTDYDKTVDFRQYKTYTWATPDIQVGKNPVYNSDLITSNIEATLKTELTKRGLSLNPESPDLLVGFHTYTDKKTKTVSYGPSYPLYYPFGFRGGWRYLPYGYGNWPYAWNNNMQQVPYTEGTLVVDIADAKTRQLIWRGVIEGDVSNPNRIEKEVTKGVEKIMKDDPVKGFN